MDTGLLAWQFLIGQIVTQLIVFIIFWIKINRKEEKDNKAIKDKRESQINKLEKQNKFLQEEIEKAQANHASAQAETQELKKDAELNEALLRQKGLSDKMELERLGRQEIEFKDRIVQKQHEIEKLIFQKSTMENELKEKNEGFQLLDKENKLLADRLKDLGAQIEGLKQEAYEKDNVIAEFKDRSRENTQALKGKVLATNVEPEKHRVRKKKNVGDILLENNMIKKDILDRALQYQATSGRSLTHCLLAYGLIDEGKLVQCLSTQFSFPYLPIRSYEIPDYIIKLVPIDIVEKYWLIPIDKIGDVLTIAMADPLDTKAVKEVEEITDCKVQVFVGLFSELMEALVNYYKIAIKGKVLATGTTLPFFIEVKSYKGLDRRQSPRFKSKIDISFNVEGHYIIHKTEDVSREGFLFYSESALSIGSLITLQIDLPKESYPLPIAAVAQVARVKPLENNKFEIALRIMKIARKELDIIIEYAYTHGEEKDKVNSS